MYNKQIFYVGSFSKAFHVLGLDRSSGRLERIHSVEDEPCPAYLRLSESEDRLYIANEHHDDLGGVSVYDTRCPEAPGLLSFWRSDTVGPAHIALMKDGENACLLGAGYFDGRVQAWPLDEDGGVRRLSCTVRHTGTGPFRYEHYISVQDRPRAHCAVPVPGTDLFLCADLGTDEVYVYRLRAGQIEPVSKRKMRLASGPRHIEVHGSGRIFYLISELDSTVSVLRVTPDNADIEVLQRISTLPDSFTGISWAAAVHLSPDGRFLYAANRGHESICIFRVSDDGCRLESAGWFAEEIRHCRDFCFDESGEFMLTCSLDANCVSLNRVDRGTGAISHLYDVPGLAQPSAIIAASPDRYVPKEKEGTPC